MTIDLRGKVLLVVQVTSLLTDSLHLINQCCTESCYLLFGVVVDHTINSKYALMHSVKCEQQCNECVTACVGSSKCQLRCVGFSCGGIGDWWNVVFFIVS